MTTPETTDPIDTIHCEGCHFTDCTGLYKDDKAAINTEIARQVAEARLDELSRLLAKITQHHERTDGKKHLLHIEASEDIVDRIAQLKGKPWLP